jgi:hypothetical protein
VPKPGGTALGKTTIVGVTVKDALALSPDDPVTVTVYVPPPPARATVKEPDTTPLDTVHTGFEMRPLGDDEIVQAVSAGPKFLPDTTTTVPRGPEAGDNVTVGPTVTIIDTS